MPTESSRTRSVRRITAPGDTGTYIDLKVIDDITFTEQEPPYQEWVLAFKNNPTDSARTVHVVEVGDDKLKVERIDTLNTTETTGISQEAIWSFLNNDSPPVHLETHETTIYASDGNGNITDTGTWIKVQRIDKIEFTDSADEVPGQEYVWSLDNPDKQDSQDDYKNLTAPIRTWDNTTINPPWRLDPFQTITDCSFGRYMLVLYGTNKIAYFPMSQIAAPLGKVTTQTLAESSWNTPAWWADRYGNPLSSFFLVSAQIKLSANFHPFTTSMKIDNGVISLYDHMEQRPFYNVADTLQTYAECSTPVKDNGISATVFGFTNYPIINGSTSFIFNEYLDKFEVTKNGIKKTVSGVYAANLTNAMPYNINSPQALTISGERHSGVFYTDPCFVIGGVSYGSYTQTQYDAYIEFINSFSDNIMINNYHYFGPSDSDFSGEAYQTNLGFPNQNTYNVTTKAAFYKKENSLDKFDIYDDLFTGASSYVPTDYDLFKSSIEFKGKTLNIAKFGMTGNVENLKFPYNLGKEFNSSYVYYDINEYPIPEGSGSFHYITPYEQWEVTESGFNSSSPFIGWLHISNGIHHLQGYLKNGSKRLYLDGVEYGSKLAAAIGCDINDIVTVIMDVKPSDIQGLK